MSTLSTKEMAESALTEKNPRVAYNELISTNDSQFFDSNFENTRKVLNERSEIHDDIVSTWFNSIVKKSKYEGPLAFIAHGGYGRREMVPFSDVDVGFLFPDEITSKNLKLEIIKEVEIDKKSIEIPFLTKYGFNFHHQIYTLENIKDPIIFNVLGVNSLCDRRILVDREGFGDKFIEEIIKNRRVFSHLDFLVNEWKKMIYQPKFGLDNLNSFNIKEDIGGLRHFQLGLRIPRIGSAESLTAVYPEMYEKNKEVMGAYDFLQKIRGFIHLRRKPNFIESRKKGLEFMIADPELIQADTLNYSDYLSIGEIFGREAQKNLLESRRIIANFADIEIGKTLKKGYSHNGFTYGPHGIFVSNTKEELENIPLKEKRDKMFNLFEIIKVQNLPADLVEYLDRFDGLENGEGFLEKFARLFYLDGEPTCVLDLLNRKGYYNSCIPGAKELEVYSPKGGHKGQFLTSTAFGRQKIADWIAKSLESEVKAPPKGRFNFKEVKKQIPLEDEVAAFFAFQTARIPQVIGMSNDDYYSYLKKESNGVLTDRTIETLKFLVNQRDTFSSANIIDGVNNGSTVEKAKNAVCSIERLNILRAYTEIDLKRKEENLEHWKIFDDLYFKIRDSIDSKNGTFRGIKLDIIDSNYSDEELEIISELKKGGVLDGAYRPLAISLIPKFNKVKKSLSPYISLPDRNDDGSELHLCSEDFPGLLRLISGKCFESNIDISQVHAYTLPRSNIIFDVFNLINLPRDFSKHDWISSLTLDITQRKTTDKDPDKILEKLDYTWYLEDCQDYGLTKLAFDTKEHRQGYLYALTSALYSAISANIYAAKSSRENGEHFRVFFKSPVSDINSMNDSLSRYFKK